MTGTIAGRVAGFAVRFRVPLVGGWVIVLAAAVLLLPSLGSQSNSDLTLFLPSGAPSVQASDLAAPLLGGSQRSTITVVISRSSGSLNRADLAAARREASMARRVPGVVSVREGAISPLGNAAQIDVQVAENAKDVSALKKIVNSVEGTFASARVPAGTRMHLAGPVATNVAANASGNKSSRQISLFSILIIVVLLLIVLRSFLAALVTFVPSVVALLISQRVIGELGAHGTPISSITQTLLVVLLLGAGTDYGLFLVYRFREELRGGGEPRDAVVRALTRVGESIAASASTVILALLTLLFAGFGLYHDLGVPLAIGMAVMLLSGVTLVPALLAMAAPLIFRSAAGRDTAGRDTAGHGAAGHGAAGQGGAGRDTADGGWGRVAAHVARRPAVVLGAGVVVLAALAAAALGYHTAAVQRSTTAPAGSDSAAGNAVLARYFPDQAVNPTNLVLRYGKPAWADPAALAAASRSLKSAGLFTTLSGPLDPNGTTLSPARYAALRADLGDARKLPLAEPAGSTISRPVYNAYRASARYVSADGTTIRFTGGLRAASAGATAAMNATPAVRAALRRAGSRSGAVATGVAGRSAALYDVTRSAGSDLTGIVPIAAAAIALLLGLVLRSLIAPLYLVVSVVLSYLAALGLTTLLVVDLGGQDGLVFVLPFLMFVFLLALGEDYNILAMTRIREEARTLPTREAVVRAIRRTGTTITSAGLILAGTFAVFALFGGGVMGGQLQAIGLGLMLGILMDTFIVRTLLVPSTVVLLGRWNWWPAPMSRRPRAAPETPARGEPVAAPGPAGEAGPGRAGEDRLDGASPHAGF